jgi:hypothetical protein
VVSKEHATPNGVACGTLVDGTPGTTTATVSACRTPASNASDAAHRLTQRQKQLDFGKNTLGYTRYLELVPR